MGSKLKVILSMAVFGTVAIFVKNIPLSSGEVSLYRGIIASLAIIIYKYASGGKIVFGDVKKNLPILFLSGAFMGFNWIFLFQAYNYTTVSIATLSYYFAPVLVMSLCPILFKEKITVKQIVCFIMATAGLVMIIGVSGPGKGDNNILGIIYGLIAAALYATVIILNKYIKNFDGIDRTLIQFIAAIIVVTPYVINTSGINIMNISSAGLINLLTLGIFHTAFTYCLYFSSIKDLKGQEAAILSYVDPLVTIILSVIILGESINAVQLMGGAMILGFTLLNELNISFIRNIKPKADGLK